MSAHSHSKNALLSPINGLSSSCVHTVSYFSIFEPKQSHRNTSVDLTANDVLKMTPKFWEMHLDPNIALDYGMFTLLVGQINLTVGTLSRYLTKRPDLAPLVDALLKGDVIGLYLLSERGHGLDALNIETTAHQQEDGSYVLNTPTEEATKYINPPFLYEAFSP